ncbi:hypothetical protein H312_03030 [Anncaliia algerae PRA339]|uniref:Uncharacterized protein n=1 Tax=Anncaliia algerae PRA339 TaxID=1288291 RepID=A0A059EX47_9MICR|nr:hypothetical protein H312_03030 [Anncaliia algerae PRA339]
MKFEFVKTLFLLSKSILVGCSKFRYKACKYINPTNCSEDENEMQLENINDMRNESISASQEVLTNPENNFSNEQNNGKNINPILMQYGEFVRNDEKSKNELLSNFNPYLFVYDVTEKNNKIIFNVFINLKDEKYFNDYIKAHINKALLESKEKISKILIEKNQEIQERYKDAFKQYLKDYHENFILVEKFYHDIDSFFWSKFVGLEKLFTNEAFVEIYVVTEKLCKYKTDLLLYAIVDSNISQNEDFDHNFFCLMSYINKDILARRFILIIIKSYYQIQ